MSTDGAARRGPHRPPFGAALAAPPRSTSSVAPLIDAYRERHRRADTDADRAGLRGRPRRPRRAGPALGRALHRPPARRRDDPRRPRPRRRHDRRRAAPRRGRGHDASPSTTSSASSAPTSPRSSTASPSSTASSSTPRRRSRPRRCARCSWRWPRTSGSCSSSSPTGSTTCARSRRCPRRSSGASRRRRSTSTRRSRTGSASPT